MYLVCSLCFLFFFFFFFFSRQPHFLLHLLLPFICFVQSLLSYNHISLQFFTLRCGVLLEQMTRGFSVS
ncbi:hypothetical protein F5050DRAFT_1778416 [Lentinula boryana]|uniref:Secreted protein n=1 Tax=Lentinula boryana TaxID=40481 RepID=A0ABQ8Q5W7_9AGAR|nr:hypothetical protein F5050DRAFT_1778416 [Lentinula boryana]